VRFLRAPRVGFIRVFSRLRSIAAITVLMTVVYAPISEGARTTKGDPWGTTALYQADLSEAEGQAAIELIRDRYGPLAGVDLRSILAYPAAGEPFYINRLVYVSAHPAGADPIFGAWVDLTTDRITKEWGTLANPALGQTRRFPDAVAAAPSAAPTALLLPTPANRLLEWGGWRMNFELNGMDEGLVLRAVTYNGHLVAEKISLPVMVVGYAGDVCGPYADRMGFPLLDIPWASNETIAYQERVIDGATWREIGIRNEIGDYNLYQSYVLSPSGVLEARLAGSGLQCPIDHVHTPTWFLNLDVDGGWEDRMERGATLLPLTQVEFDDVANLGWAVSDSRTGMTVTIGEAVLALDTPAATLVPDAGQHRLSVRGFRTQEDAGWRFGARLDIPYKDNEPLATDDLALWYQGYMDHAATDGAAHWHASGLRLTVTLGSGAAITEATTVSPVASLPARRLPR
jgi:Copper amine oxidase, enzyme domain